MKVLLVNSLGHIAGGAETSISVMKHELTARGHEVRVLTADSPGVDLFSEYQFQPISKSSPLKSLHHLFYFRSYRALRHAIRDFQPDIVHFNVMTACTPSVLFGAGDTPAIMTIHGPEEFTLSLLPWFMDSHDFKTAQVDRANFTPKGRLKYWFYLGIQRPIYQLGLRRLRLVLAPSRYMKEATAGDFPGVAVRTLYNGIPLPKPEPLPQKKVVLYVGRLVRLKGVDYLLRAFAQVAPAESQSTLRIVGDGPELAALKLLAKSLRISDRVQFTGWVPREVIAREYAAATVLVVPSVAVEGLGLVAIEAMATGRPVIASDTGGIPELVTEDVTGLLVPPADADSLAAALTKLLKSDKMISNMGRAAIVAAQKFSETTFVDATEAVYQEVAGAHPGTRTLLRSTR